MRMADDLPRFQGYQDALDFVQRNEPVRNTHDIPLRPGRKSRELYYAQYNDRTGEISLFHHRTPLVTFCRDGLVHVVPFSSESSVSFLNQTTPWSFGQCRGRVVVMTQTGDQITGHTLDIRDNAIINPREAFEVPVGRGRRYNDKQVGRFMQSLKDYRRALSQVAGVASPYMIPEYSKAWAIAGAPDHSASYESTKHVTQWAHAWSPGQEFPLVAVGMPQGLLTALAYKMRAEIKPHRPDLATSTETHHNARLLVEAGHLQDPDGFLDDPVWVAPVPLHRRYL